MEKIQLYFGCPPDKLRIPKMYAKQLGEHAYLLDYEVTFFANWQEMREAIKNNKPNAVILPETMAYDKGIISFANAKKDLEKVWAKKRASSKTILTELEFKIGVGLCTSLDGFLRSATTTRIEYKNANWVYTIHEYIQNQYKIAKKRYSNKDEF